MTQLHFPAEWAPQDGVLLTWPNDRGDWAPYLAQVEPVFIDIAREVALRERLIISCYDTAHCQQVRTRLQAAGVDMTRVALHAIPANDTWARDHGPITVYADAKPRLLDFVFNGWGGKYNAELDNQITPQLVAAGAFAAASEVIDLVLEGGGIETDGAGTLLTTTSCLLAPTRNPQLTQLELEDRLRALLGVERILWLNNGHLEGDDTDGHIDTLARFCPSTPLPTKAAMTHKICTIPPYRHWLANCVACRRATDIPIAWLPCLGRNQKWISLASACRQPTRIS